VKVQPITLVGKFVCLEPLRVEHAPGLFAISDPSIWEYMLYGEIRSEEDLRGWVADMLARALNGTDLPFVVIHCATQKIVGSTRYLEIRSEHRGLEIGGTWYGLDYQRTAVNTECKYLLLKHAFENLDCIRVQFKTDSRNEKSLKAIERLGAKREGILRNHMILPDGGLRHSVYYSIVDSEWPEIKIKLEKILSYK
jgi:RimJ/RimL family protein N-acetyltransferase